MNNHYNKSLKPFARNLRNNSTKAEIRLWCELLQGKQMLGYTFLRQRPVAEFIADFMQKDLKLIIEVDGHTHSFEEVCEKDFLKDKRLKELGVTVLRFEDDEVMEHSEAVRMKIEDVIREIEKSSPWLCTKPTQPPSHTHIASRKVDFKTASQKHDSKPAQPLSHSHPATHKGDTETSKFSAK